MLTSVQKEILQTLINLYQSSEGKSIKGEDIAEVMNRNPGTIRNQMQSLRSLSLVKGVPGPRGGYKPTVEAYHSLNIHVSDNDSKVPIYKDGNKLEDVSVARIEFTSVPKPTECEAAIKVLGDIKNLKLGDSIRIGPTPVNNLGVMGTIVGRDDMDNILLVSTKTIRSIPKKTVGEIASKNIIFIEASSSLKDAAKILSDNDIDGAPVRKNGEIIGIFTVYDILNALTFDNDKPIEELISNKFISVKEDLKIGKAIKLMSESQIERLMVYDDEDNLIGIVTRTDLIDTITNLKEFPVIAD